MSNQAKQQKRKKSKTGLESSGDKGIRPTDLEGAIVMDQQTTKGSEKANKRIDPMTVLPLEVFSLVLQNFSSMRSIVALSGVSKLWGQSLGRICRPGWIRTNWGMDIDWWRSMDRTRKASETNDWDKFKQEVRSCYNLNKGFPISGLVVDDAHRTGPTILCDEFSAAITESGRAFVQQVLIIHKRKSGMDGLPQEEQFGPANLVPRDDILAACDEHSVPLYDWKMRFWATGRTQILLYLEQNLTSRVDPKEKRAVLLVCVCAKTGRIVWSRSRTRIRRYKHTENELQEEQSINHSMEIPLYYWQIESVSHGLARTSTALFTYLIRPIQDDEDGIHPRQIVPRFGRVVDDQKFFYPPYTIHIRTLDLKTGMTIDPLSWDLENAGYGRSTDTAFISDFPTTVGMNGALRLLALYDLVAKQWELRILDLTRKVILARCKPYCSLPEELGARLQHDTDWMARAGSRGLVSVAGLQSLKLSTYDDKTVAMGPCTVVSKTVYMIATQTLSIYSSMTPAERASSRLGLDVVRAISVDVEIANDGEVIRARASPKETSVYERYRNDQLNPRARLAVGYRHRKSLISPVQTMSSYHRPGVRVCRRGWTKMIAPRIPFTVEMLPYKETEQDKRVLEDGSIVSFWTWREGQTGQIACNTLMLLAPEPSGNETIDRSWQAYYKERDMSYEEVERHRRQPLVRKVREDWMGQPSATDLLTVQEVGDDYIVLRGAVFWF
ncbi:hypothetical protein BJ508DRAFT_417325 [Ascobolus immersus RN42]|uniref:F-box domain-containing protein n=1 Tax=Ascobolus immersus RN42 TaxID=1160509 RepID=A0A3N4HT54_ASCIM|nr:hypothetical protein BJ508DRAFT_417325 [Ascobolus immersus RN42]